MNDSNTKSDPISAPPRFGEWLPIETAPKDGSQVLICADGHVFLAYWNPEFDSVFDDVLEKSIPVGQWTDDAVASFAYETTQYIEFPTHWMPLPEPPK